MARRNSGPEFFVIASSNSCLKSNMVLSGGDSIAKLSGETLARRKGGTGQLRRRRTSIPQHLIPVVPVQVVHGPSSTDE